MAALIQLSDMTYRDVVMATADPLSCRQWLRANRLLASNVPCPRCGTLMREGALAESSDGLCWRCPRKGCKLHRNFRHGSFFAKSHVPLPVLVDLIYLWAMEVSQKQMRFQLHLEKVTIIDWCSFLRDVCSADLLANPVQLGGSGHIVAIDESVVAKSKPAINGRARPVPQQWLFGATDLTTKEYLLVMVPSRDAATLLPIITANIAAGTEIWSDQWAAYNGLNGLGYIHRTVNHSQHFVDPHSGVHTNNIEARWAIVKASMKKRFGVVRKLLPGYLDEAMWRSRLGTRSPFSVVIEAIKRQYPVQ